MNATGHWYSLTLEPTLCMTKKMIFWLPPLHLLNATQLSFCEWFGPDTSWPDFGTIRAL